jgi:hypothetical protein
MAPTSQGVALVPLVAVVKREYPNGVLLLPTISPSVYVTRQLDVWPIRRATPHRASGTRREQR